MASGEEARTTDEEKGFFFEGMTQGKLREKKGVESERCLICFELVSTNIATKFFLPGVLQGALTSTLQQKRAIAAGF